MAFREDVFGAWETLSDTARESLLLQARLPLGYVSYDFDDIMRSSEPE